MRYFGYHRTSTADQHLDRGITEIERYAKEKDFALKKIYTDRQTGKNFNRPGYLLLKEVLDEGDCLIITEIDRLGRNKQETMAELRWFKEHGIRLLILEIPTTLMEFGGLGNEMARLMLETINNLMIEIYVTMAEGEMHKKEKRQREGLEALRARGEWDKMGRPRVMEQDRFDKEYERVLKGEIPPFKLMRELGLKKSTYYNLKKSYEKTHPAETEEEQTVKDKPST